MNFNMGFAKNAHARLSFRRPLNINDLPENIQSQVRLFVDDTAVYLTVTNMQDSQVLQSDLESLQHWERTWDMDFKPGKCQVIHITCSKSPVKCRYFMHNQELESVDAARYLGVTISKDLSWNTHINNIICTANKTLGFVIRNVVTKNKKYQNHGIQLPCPSTG